MSSKKATTRQRTVAVIDIGTTSVRMAIAEINTAGTIQILEHLSQAVDLGKDTFTRGRIHRETIEECVQVLKSYQQILSEYGIQSADELRVVATSAVREATNRLGFLDRIYIATGITIDPMDEAEISRITYLGIQSELERLGTSTDTVVCEVGGGSTELLLVRDGQVQFSHTYNLGSLRLRKAVDTYNAPIVQSRQLMESQIQRTIDLFHEHIPVDQQRNLVALGGDMRFAASQLIDNWNIVDGGIISTDDLEEFTNDILHMSLDNIVSNYELRVTHQEAETLGPALLTYLCIAKNLDVPEIHISGINLRDGLLQEMALEEAWSKEFKNQIIGSVLELGRKYDFDEAHAQQVASLAGQLFHQLQPQHDLEPRFETFLQVAALLHEIGLFVSNRSYHKHTMYLINNSELFGLGKTNLMLTALVARYHRRATPQTKHAGYAMLDRDHRVAVSKLAAILRISVALDASRNQNIHTIRCMQKGETLILSSPDVADLSLEQLALQQSSDLFEETFGMKILLSNIMTDPQRSL
ncbi:MAG: exopolyphosphatase [Planctomycetaceae bacterium]|nr:exopolyphosphatase [Planctomycetaceae bacterium]